MLSLPVPIIIIGLGLMQCLNFFICLYFHCTILEPNSSFMLFSLYILSCFSLYILSLMAALRYILLYILSYFHCTFRAIFTVHFELNGSLALYFTVNFELFSLYILSLTAALRYFHCTFWIKLQYIFYCIFEYDCSFMLFILGLIANFICLLCICSSNLAISYLFVVPQVE